MGWRQNLYIFKYITQNMDNMWIAFDSVLLNHFYLSAIKSLQVWVDDVLVGRKFLEISSSALSKFLWK